MVRITLLFVCLTAGPIAGCATAPPPGPPAAEAEPTPAAVIAARGMSCPQCAGSADRRLMMIDGVTWTRIDLGAGTVTVGLDPRKPTPDAETLRAAVQDAGFTAGSVTLPAEDGDGAGVGGR